MKDAVPLNSVYSDSSTLPCIVCGKELKNVFQEMESNLPSEATSLKTVGHYGDTYFYTETCMELEVNICNPCISKAWEEGKACYYPDTDDNSIAFVKGVKSGGG